MLHPETLEKALTVLADSDNEIARAQDLVGQAWTKLLHEIRELPELQGAFIQMERSPAHLNKSLCLQSLLKERSAQAWWKHSVKHHVSIWLMDGTLNDAEDSEEELEGIEIVIEEMFGLPRFSRIQNAVAKILTQ
jgi:hypothetical protein